MSPEKNMYDISSYGLDYPVEVLVSMIERGDLEAPDFQRNYVWQISQASRFIESCIVGLPIPTIFFFKDKENKFLIVDGLQRLMTAKFFKEGLFKNRIFTLSLPDNQELNGKTYEQLPVELRRRFDQCVLRATVFTQNKPDKGMKSVYEVFSRLNSGGSKLTSHEVRNAIIRGRINPFLEDVNKDSNWRALYGRREAEPHRRDEEVILRIFALNDGDHSYTPPMNLFLNTYMEENVNPSKGWQDEKSSNFAQATKLIVEILGKDAFRLKKGSQINVALADALMVSVMQNLPKLESFDDGQKSILKKKIQSAKTDSEFLDSVEKNTSDSKRVRKRISEVQSIIAES